MPSIEQLEKLLAAAPDDTFVLYALAQEHAKQERYPTAVEFYDRCLSVDPAYCYAYFHKARSLQALGQDEEAIAVLRAGIDAAKQAADAHALSELSGYLDEIAP